MKPDYTGAYHNLGILYDENDQYADALINYNKAIELQPDSPHIYCALGNVQHKLTRYGDALFNYNKAIELQPEDGAITYYNLGNTLNELAHFEKLSEIIRKQFN